MKLLISAFFTLLVIVFFSASYGQTEEIVEPAYFSPDQIAEIIRKIELPQIKTPYEVVIKCAGVVTEEGTLRDKRVALCGGIENERNSLGSKEITSLVKSVEKGTAGMKLNPAMINGRAVDIWFNFHVKILAEGNSTLITLRENQLLNESYYGENYISSQRYLLDKNIEKLRCGFPKPKNMFSLAIQISAFGKPADYRILEVEQLSRNCKKSIEEFIKDSGFIPAMVDGDPVDSIYVELFYGSTPTGYKHQLNPRPF